MENKDLQIELKEKIYFLEQFFFIKFNINRDRINITVITLRIIYILLFMYYFMCYFLFWSLFCEVYYFINFLFIIFGRK